MTGPFVVAVATTGSDQVGIMQPGLESLLAGTPRVGWEKFSGLVVVIVKVKLKPGLLLLLHYLGITTCYDIWRTVGGGVVDQDQDRSLGCWERASWIGFVAVQQPACR